MFSRCSDYAWHCLCMALFTGYTTTLSLQPCGAQGLRLSQQGLGCLPLTAGVLQCSPRSPHATFHHIMTIITTPCKPTQTTVRRPLS